MKRNKVSQASWHIPVILAFRGLRQEDLEFEVSLDYMLKPCLKQNKTKR
jgi:hypothetical protein